MWKFAIIFVLFATAAFADYGAPPTAATIWTCNAAQRGNVAVATSGGDGLAWGATLTSGGTTTYYVWCNGTNWTVMGK